MDLEKKYFKYKKLYLELKKIYNIKKHNQSGGNNQNDMNNIDRLTETPTFETVFGYDKPNYFDNEQHGASISPNTVDHSDHPDHPEKHSENQTTDTLSESESSDSSSSSSSSSSKLTINSNQRGGNQSTTFTELDAILSQLGGDKLDDSISLSSSEDDFDSSSLSSLSSSDLF